MSTARDTWLFGLFFLSGFAGLVYEVLWMKELGLLFGNTAHAAATTLASFFLGLAAGGYVFGRRVTRLDNPLKGYAALELGVAVSALLYFWLLDVYYAIYGPVHAYLGTNTSGLLAVKFLLAVGVLFPPAFFMGGTLPIMAQVVAPRIERLGRRGTALYAVNTAGAAIGAYVAGFHLPMWLGYQRSYLAAIALTVLVALTAWLVALRALVHAPVSSRRRDTGSAPRAKPLLPLRWLPALAFISGFVALSLEVLWTRMFAQVLQNSVYTFSVVLVIFLISLALGAVLASALARCDLDMRLSLCSLLIGSGLLVAVTPNAFLWVTEGVGYLGGEAGFSAYVIRVFGAAAVVMLVPGILLGAVFPYLMKISEGFDWHSGRAVGDLAATNTLGAIMGATAAGFLFLESLGVWASVQLMSIAYLAAAVAVAWRTVATVQLVASVVVLVAVIVSMSHWKPLPVRIDPASERLYEVWEGSAATVAVVEQQRERTVSEMGSAAEIENITSRRIKINNYYHVGGTESRKWEAWQTHLPLFLHPHPRRVFYLGMGTGITAGAALEHPVDRVVVAEIVPEVIEASRKYFAAYVNGLFSDPRVSVVAEDGRHYLQVTGERFDVIIADLFMPWKAGTASLYTREHFTSVRRRLTTNGLFVQWLPLYQMSRQEVGIVARTMLEAFPLVTVWRGDFFSQTPAMALIGHAQDAPLSPDALGIRLLEAPGPARGDTPLAHFVPEARELLRHPAMPTPQDRFLLYYAGNLRAARAIVDAHPVNTDDRPVVEYLAPMTQRRQTAGEAEWLVGVGLATWLAELFRHSPPHQDPYLRRHPRGAAFSTAGLDFFRVQVWELAGDRMRAQQALRRFSAVVFGTSR